MASKAVKFVTDFETTMNGECRKAGVITNHYGVPVVYRKGTCTGMKVDGVNAKGAAEVIMKTMSPATGTIKKGDHFLIAGDATDYTCTEDETFVGGAGTVKCDPVLAAATAGDEAVTWTPCFLSNGLIVVEETDGDGSKGAAAADLLVSSGRATAYP